MPNCRLTRLAVLAFVLASSSRAVGAGPDESKREAATEHFTSGLKLSGEEQWDAALAEFVTAVGLFPLKNAQKNAARCLYHLGRYDEALAAWRAVVEQFADKLKPEESAEATREISALQSRVGTLVIRANVDGATVVVDGRERGKTPLREPVVVLPGTRLVRVAKEGFAPFEARPIVAQKSSVAVEVRLDALARVGRLRVVEEQGKTLDVVVDGAVVGKTPIYEGVIAPGPHAVLLRGGGRIGTPPTSANVVVDQTLVLRVRAEPLGSDVRINPQPGNAAIVVDGVPVGHGTWEGALRVGAHTAGVTSNGYFAASRAFQTTADNKSVLEIALERDRDSPEWNNGRRYPLSFGLFGGVAAGLSLGGELEGSCSSGADCYERRRPIGFRAGVRAAYDVVPVVAIELEVGYARVGMGNARRTSLLGDVGLVPVDIRDEVTLGGPFAGVGAAFAIVREPLIVAAALGGGVILANVDLARSGTVNVDAPPNPRLLDTGPIQSVRAAVPYLSPQARLVIPVGDRLKLGVALGALIGLSSSRPEVHQFARAEGGTNAQYSGKPIGFLPRNPSPNGNESATGTFVLPEAQLFAKVAF